MDVPEEALRPEDSGTIYAHCMEHIQLADERYGPCSKTLDALEEARGLDQEVKRHIPKHGSCSKSLHGLSQIHGPCSDDQRHGACSKNRHGPSQPHDPKQIHGLYSGKQLHGSRQIHGSNQFVKHNPCMKTSPYQLGLPMVHGVFDPSQPTRILLRPPDGAKPKQEA